MAGAAIGGQMAMEGLGMVADMAGQLHQAHQQTKEASKARKFAAWMYANRHQMEVKDLRAAGLNPLLSSQYGAGSVPSSPMAQMPNIMEGFGDSVRGLAKNVQEVISRGKQQKLLDQDLIRGRAEVDTIVSQKLKNMAEMRLFESLNEKSIADTDLSRANAVSASQSAEGMRLENMYKMLGLPRAKADEELFNTWYGEWSRKMGTVIRGVLGREATGAR